MFIGANKHCDDDCDDDNTRIHIHKAVVLWAINSRSVVAFFNPNKQTSKQSFKFPK